MILKSLKLRNIRSYVNELIEFPKGAVLLAGDIGSGKSSILHAVEFALFGVRRDSISGSALLRKGSREGKVELKIDIDGKEVIIKRVLKRQKSTIIQDSGFIIIDNKKKDLTSTEIKAAIIELLGYPQELLTKSKSLIYRYTVYTPQEDMKKILEGDIETRIDTLRKIFGIDKYRKIIKSSMIYVKKVKDDVKLLSSHIQDIDVKQTEISFKNEQKEKLVVKLNELEPILKHKKTIVIIKKEQVKKTEEKRMLALELNKKLEVNNMLLGETVKNHSIIKKDIEELLKEKEQILNRIALIKIDNTLVGKETEIEKAIKEKQKIIHQKEVQKTKIFQKQKNILERINEIEDQIHMKKKDSKELETKTEFIKKLAQEIKDKKLIEQSLLESENAIKDNEKQLNEIKFNINNSENLKSKINSLDVCPTCQQNVEEEYKKQITGKENIKIAKLTTELNSLIDLKTRVTNKIDKYKEEIDKLIEKEHRIAILQGEVNSIEKIKNEFEQLLKIQSGLEIQKTEIFTELTKIDGNLIKKYSEDINELSTTLKIINNYKIKLNEKKQLTKLIDEKNHKTIEKQKILERTKEKIKEINSLKIKINEDLVKYLGIEEIYNQLKKELEELQRNEQKKEVEFAEIKKEIDGACELINLLNKELEFKKNAQVKIIKLTGIKNWFEDSFIKMTELIEKHILLKIHTEFTELFVGWFNILIEDENLSVRIDDSFSPLIIQNGHDIEYNHLSGGERTAIALAYRLALNKVINDIIDNIKTRNLLILDEPTDGFSSQQLDKFRDILAEINNQQTIIVSHEPKIESFVEQVITIVKTDHVSRVIHKT